MRFRLLLAARARIYVEASPLTPIPRKILAPLASFVRGAEFCRKKAAMLRPATTTERAVASVLNDVSAAIHGAEQDLVINERQARTLLSRIRRSARLPE